MGRASYAGPIFLPATYLSRRNDFTFSVLRHPRYWKALLQRPACDCKIPQFGKLFCSRSATRDTLRQV
jgi:hypothetical protein